MPYTSASFRTPSQPCPKCQSTDTRSHTPTAAGSPRIRCKTCGKVSVIAGQGKGKGGRPLQGDRALSNAERQRKFRQNKKQTSAHKVTKPSYNKEVKQIQPLGDSMSNEAMMKYCQGRKYRQYADYANNTLVRDFGGGEVWSYDSDEDWWTLN